jgi:hypothetical protein
MKTLKDVIRDIEKSLKRNIRTKEMDAEKCAKLADLLDEMKKMDAELDVLKKEDPEIPG